MHVYVYMYTYIYVSQFELLLQFEHRSSRGEPREALGYTFQEGDLTAVDRHIISPPLNMQRACFSLMLPRSLYDQPKIVFVLRRHH